jgi:NitT/TauT family transport system permease protein
MSVVWEQGQARDWLRRGAEYSTDVLRFYVAPVLAVGLAWYGISAAGWVPATLLPGPERVLRRVVEATRGGILATHLALTVRRVVVAFAAALVISLPVGAAMGFSRGLERLPTPWLVVALSIPGLIWALITLLVFGLSELTIYTAIGAGLVPMFVVNWWQGVKALDRDLLLMARVYRASKWRVARDVVLPQLLPQLFASARYGLAWGWKIVVVIEMLGFGNGVGYLLYESYHLFSMERVLAWTMAFLSVMLVLEYGVLAPLERRWTRWRPRVTFGG